ncbi:MBL fold metallo-hydrolase [Pelotomaculum terephthalicicum JT]|uniref:MBL fold metallo-hydrolase RNA specificity domain-containing protein n=1 Tax=Pelotomaculum terephthalicicum TaxID=206393 RepID=UPI0009D202E1|nr:MBL fold metallo-hydrolase [Pelotomaculum terephthalicicum]MCG9968058.1 MBL fold metallo-hydrolase [Pelotomaculum terephthalicicum JT]OPY63985.1 MAG: Ribonuclease [Pelotomaculum sp. PtaU1.Bin065]
MQLQFLGAAGTVTGSCYLLDTANTRIMVDCGMFQGPKEIRERNYGKILAPPGSVDFLLLTHAHIDHSGLIPKFVRYGFRGKIITTAPTVELCEVLLPDSGHIQEMEVERKNRKNRRANKAMIEPVYDVRDAYNSLSSFSPVSYDEIVQLTPEIRVRFVDAGHILGSAMIELWVKEGNDEIKLVFSGDIGRKDQPLIKDPSIISQADYVVMESTYGNRMHEQNEDEMELLHEAIWETYKKGGNLIIPAFAVERTQDLLYHLSLLAEAKRMPPMAIYIDSPLSTAATAVFQHSQAYFDQETLDLIKRSGNPINLPGIRFTKTAEESKSLNNVSGAIVISASGMCEAGRIRHHLKYNLWRPESTVLFVGYQPPGTLGRLILDGEKTVRIFGDEIAVRADVRSIDGYSAHADQAELMEWVRGFQIPPREIFVVHGEPDSSNALAGLIRAELGFNATVPTWRQTVNLIAASAADPLRTVYASLSSKLRNLLDCDLPQSQREEIIRRMTDLETYLDEGLKKTG